ncbi:nuclear transport factor 2 family protein [Nocardia sp. ET3-3]|uniref:Nuclear transport factor 2 family protein n=1 Tax=Nocardia terrae TaxID=2675851 RepID=A0A7K1V4H5_9NOCA|nr:nuclear transport factor 2 family protein [Nocardia terrae]
MSRSGIGSIVCPAGLESHRRFVVSLVSSGTRTVSNETYIGVQRFYAELVRALDNDQFEEAAAMFTENGELSHTPGRPAARTRQGIVDDLIEHSRARRNSGEQRKHWFGHVRLSRVNDTVLAASAYVFVIGTKPGELPRLVVSGILHDVIVEQGDGFLLKSRTVVKDGAQ